MNTKLKSSIAAFSSADSRQLFAAQHVDHAVAADAALEDYRAAGAVFNAADAD